MSALNLDRFLEIEERMMAASESLESEALALTEAAEGYSSLATSLDGEREEEEQLSIAMAISISDQNDTDEKELQEALRLIKQHESQGSSADATGLPSASQSLPLNPVSRESTSHTGNSLDGASLPRVASRKTYTFEELQEQDADYRDIKEAFDAVGVKITRVRKVINISAQKKFQNRFFEKTDEKPKGFDLNIQHLYHGTTAPEKQVCIEGFDSRLGKKGHFGVGIYFSDNPKKCVQFMSRSGPGTGSAAEPYILRCRVILGDIKEYPPGAVDMDLKREPVKETVDGSHIYYDSVKGMPNRDGLNEFIIYEGRSALIEHIINYDPHAKVDRSSSSSAAAAATTSNRQNSSSRSTTQQSLASGPTSSENTFSLNVPLRNPVPEGTNLQSGNARVPVPSSSENDTAAGGENAPRSTGQMNIPSPVAEGDSNSDDNSAGVDATDGTPRGAVAASSQQTTAVPQRAEPDDNPGGEGDTDGVPQRAAAASSQQTKVAKPVDTTILEPQRALTPLEQAHSLTLKIAATSADPDMREKLGQIEAQLRANVIGGPALSGQLLDAFEKTYIGQTLDSQPPEQSGDITSTNTSRPTNTEDSGGNTPNSDFQFPPSFPVEEEDPMEELMNYQLNEFLTITESSDLEEAKRFLALANMDMETAVTLYFDTTQGGEG